MDVAVSQLYPVYGLQPLFGAQDCGQHCGKGQRRIPEIGLGAELNSCIIPVLNKAVQVLKKPPESGTRREKQQEKSRPVRHQAVSGSVDTQRIDHHDIRKPQWAEGMRLIRDKPGKAGPRQDPGNNAGGYTNPSPPGKRFSG